MDARSRTRLAKFTILGMASMLAVALLILYTASQPATASDPRPREILLKRLEQSKDDNWARLRIIKAVAELRRPDCRDTLLKHLDDEAHQIREAALCGLMLQGHYDKKMGECLNRLIRDKVLKISRISWKHEEFQSSGHDFSKLAADVAGLFNDEDPAIRTGALNEYAMMGGCSPDAVPALIEFLKQEDNSRIQLSKLQACWILQKIGPKAMDAKPALEALLTSKSDMVASSAAVALLILDPKHEAAMRDHRGRLFGPDRTRASNAAIAMGDRTVHIFETQYEDPDFLVFRIPEAAWGFARALAKSDFTHPNIEKWLISSLTADSLLLRMDAAIALSKLYPAQRDKIEDVVKLGFSVNSVVGTDALAEHLARLDSVPPGIVAIAKEKYSKASRRASPALAMMALKANPADQEVESHLRKQLAGNNDSLAQAMTVTAIGDGGQTSLRFRDDLLKLLESDEDFVAEEAAKAIYKLDALAASKPKP